MRRLLDPGNPKLASTKLGFLIEIGAIILVSSSILRFIESTQSSLGRSISAFEIQSEDVNALVVKGLVSDPGERATDQVFHVAKEINSNLQRLKMIDEEVKSIYARMSALISASTPPAVPMLASPSQVSEPQNSDYIDVVAKPVKTRSASKKKSKAKVKKSQQVPTSFRPGSNTDKVLKALTKLHNAGKPMPATNNAIAHAAKIPTGSVTISLKVLLGLGAIARDEETGAISVV